MTEAAAGVGLAAADQDLLIQPDLDGSVDRLRLEGGRGGQQLDVDGAAEHGSDAQDLQRIRGQTRDARTQQITQAR